MDPQLVFQLCQYHLLALLGQPSAFHYPLVEQQDQSRLNQQVCCFLNQQVYQNHYY